MGCQAEECIVETMQWVAMAQKVHRIARCNDFMEDFRF
jgi:hypothetical protein